MKHILIALSIIMLYSASPSQTARNVGLIVMIEDSLTQHFVGSSEASHFSKRYAAPADFQSYATDTALVLLKQHFPKWDFCTMNPNFFQVYQQNSESLRATDFRSFREEWFAIAQTDNDVEAILVIRNSPTFTDGIHWSNTDITGYGIYNGSRRSYNNIYIQLEFWFFASGRPLTHIQGPIYLRERNYPRIDDPEDTFEESDLLMVKDPLRLLIVNQIEAAIKDANLMRRLR